MVYWSHLLIHQFHNIIFIYNFNILDMSQRLVKVRVHTIDISKAKSKSCKNIVYENLLMNSAIIIEI